MAPTIRILTVATIAVGALVVPPSNTSHASAETACGGVVFRDLDADGRRVEILERDGRADDVEPGVADVRVEVVDARGDVHDTTTRRSGEWEIELSARDYPIRIEFEVPDGFEASRPGLTAGNTVQFVATPDECDGHPLANLGIYPPDEFCASRPDVAVPCYVTARAPSYESQPAIRVVSNRAVDDGDAGASSIGDWLAPTSDVLATVGQVGTVYGQAARRDGTLFAAAFTKRHTALASDLNPDGNPTVIYRVRVGKAPEVFATLDMTASDPHGDPARPRAADDLEVMDEVFTSGIGDIELSPDETTLYAVDLGRRQLVAIDAETGAVRRRHVLDGAALDRADCAVTNSARFGDLRAFGLGWLDDELLVGVVCSAASTVRADRMVSERGEPGSGAGDHDQLVGYVYGFRSGDFRELLAWPLATDRGETHSNELLSNEAIWHPWAATYPFDAEHVAVSYPQPAITDLVVDADGDLVIALGDRWSHQTAPETDAPARDGSTRRITETIAAGDLQRACRRSRGWVIEGTPGCAGGFGNGWEFFDGESYGWQAETALGSIARLPGRHEVVATQMNPIPEDHAWSAGGLVWHDTDTGDRRDGVRLYDRAAAPPGATFENASGLGDLAVLCGGPPLSIGGSVWHDADANGRRDPGDGPVVGAAVELLDVDGAVVSVDFSDEQGIYAFDDSNVRGGLTAGARYVLSMGERNLRPGVGVLAGTGAHTGLVPTAPEMGDRDDLDSDARVTDSMQTGSFGASIEVRAGADPATGAPERPSEHHYDFGLRDRYDLAVTTSAGPSMRDAGVVAFRLEVRNEGSVPSGSFELRSDLPPETSLQPGAASVAPTSIADGSIIWAFDDDDSIGPGDVLTIDLRLRVNDPSVESITSSVEITRDSGRDEDSDPGLVWGEDDEDELIVELFGIAGRIWVDVEDDDVAAHVEQGAGGVVVNVLAEDGTRVGGTTTDATGRFLFDSLPAGNYRVGIPASEFESGRPLQGHDQAVGGSSRNVGRMLDREGYVTSDVIELGDPDGERSPNVELGVLRRPPTPLIDLVVPMVLAPITLLCVAALYLDRRRHLGGSLRPAGRT